LVAHTPLTAWPRQPTSRSRRGVDLGPARDPRFPRRATARRGKAALDGPRSAALVRLRYVTERAPGIVRRRSGRRMRYAAPAGRPIRSLDVLRRIKRLAIPPAWTDVWICADPDGHLQAVGRDARGRRQYRYHERWRQVRDEVKYGRMLAFGRALPR